MHSQKKSPPRFPLVVQDLLISLAGIAAAVMVSHLLSRIYDDNNPFATSIFILAVAIVSRFTRGYWPGILASVTGVVCVNYLFTYPFGEFDLSITGYPLTFAVMLLVSIFISTLTTQVKRQEHLRFEAEKDKMRANLLRAVSHDIRTPLTSILGSSSAMLESGALTPEECVQLAGDIHRNALWLLRMTENILSVTRFGEDGVVLQKTDEVVEEIVGSAITRFRKTCHTDIPIDVRKPDEILLAPMDATLIEQLLLNLLENVVQHGQTPTQIQIEIEQAPEKICLSICDNGGGIPKNLLPVLFDGYASSGGSGLPDQNRRVGIGLAVCRAIVRAHGGEISVKNNAMGGATFSFWLPTREEELHDS